MVHWFASRAGGKGYTSMISSGVAVADAALRRFDVHAGAVPLATVPLAQEGSALVKRLTRCIQVDGQYLESLVVS
jgi:hypothetical protein